jgi:CDP-diacylglycerol--glycerol-3-phosphate 3-phosphatidyltransferase
VAKRLAMLWLVQAVTLCRVAGALLFACIALQGIPVVVIACCYSLAIVSDVVDGFLARRFHAATYLGKILDLVSDKSLTIVSLLYAAERRVPFAPLALIGVREFAMTGMRLVTVRGAQVLPTNRVFGGTIAMILWGSTLLIVVAHGTPESIAIATKLYWISAVALGLNLGVRIYGSRARIIASLADEQSPDQTR